MFGKWTERDDFTVLTAHFRHHFRHQLLAYALPFKAGINIRMFDNTQMLASRNEDNLSNLISSASFT
jgi:hypothetical protein